MLRAGSRDRPPPRGQPQPHRRVLCGVLGTTMAPGWMLPPPHPGTQAVLVPGGHQLRTPAAAALCPRRGVGPAGAGPAPARKGRPFIPPPPRLPLRRACCSPCLLARCRLRASPGRSSQTGHRSAGTASQPPHSPHQCGIDPPEAPPFPSFSNWGILQVQESCSFCSPPAPQ